MKKRNTIKICRSFQLSLVVPILSLCASLSLASYAQAQANNSPTGFSTDSGFITDNSTASLIETRAQLTPSWYMSRQTPSTVHTDPTTAANGDLFDSWIINGGYQYQVSSNVTLFWEAGLLNQANDQTPAQRFNFTTGVEYTPLPKMQVKSRLTQFSKTKETPLDTKLQLLGSYQVTESLDLQATYDLMLDNQTMQLGIDYRF